ncbi:MAG TPA: undecaprenyldiphospho-muramoylpentapeptide beta-N-acetylglucosaminyltransferase [Vicinamibacterales bacterium]|nr:undecaprenyldiphospho-muramoylpentapeptide beta-N-acetylglucosaminyltransferase [Vicinamibacterales bacterium]
MSTSGRGSLRIVIAGGGTGGHLYPGIAVARELLRRAPDAQVTFAGTARGLEARVVPQEGFALDVIRSGGLKGKSIGARLRGVALLPVSGADAWRVLTRRRPHLVIGVGGYSSGPVVLLAALRGTPTLLLEQNAVPGLTNRLLARVVDAAAVTYDSSLPYFGAKGFVTGNPVRAGFVAREEGQTHDGRPGQPARVLILGGSQGAHAINLALVAAAPRLAAAGTRLALTHQTGERDLDLVRDGYRRAGLAARVEPFLHGMEREMGAVDLVVSRAGATTLAEIAAAGRPSILIPLPTATDDHQRKNAEVLQRAGAADLLHQRDMTGDALADALLALAGDAERRGRMGRAAAGLARPDAAGRIAERALALARGAHGANAGGTE